ncbi:hypothetical protein [Alsobacter soli]|uniref:hypothetical protein n=1 Tax=Alsobacter soli TaxID=2109933 RepID=UPI001FDF03B6|nr:hypothetical protein [Alsobacter soli]
MSGTRSSDADLRKQRLAAALRDNLKRRKAQARARQDEPASKAAPAKETPQGDPEKA